MLAAKPAAKSAFDSVMELLYLKKTVCNSKDYARKYISVREPGS